MKIERLFRYCLLAGTFLLASCSNEDVTDNPVETLPEGMYPLTFTATQGEVVATPQTRVSDYDDTDGTHKSKWDGGDQIEVKVSDNTGNTMGTTTCTLDENGNITAYNPQLYWQTTGNYTINAWYSNITGQNTTSTTVSLADQSSGLAYVLKADQLTNQNYKSGNIALTFKHQLAKVRVKVEKGTYEGDLTNATVKMKGCYTSCTVSEGTVTAGSTTGDITMRKVTAGSDTYYEANAVPGTPLKDDAFEISSANGKNTATANLASEITLTAATVNTITLTIDKAGPKEITPGADGNYTVNEGADVLIKGNGSQTTGQIIINGTATVTIQNVNIKTQEKPTISITNGTATIKLSGNNILESTGSKHKTAAGTQLNNVNSNVIIEGNDNNSLTITADYGNPAIGSGNGGKGGNITIRNATITANAINTIGFGCGAAIGSGSSWVSSEAHIGIITIINSNITASVRDNKNSSAAVIGTGDTTGSNDKNSCQGINITLKDGQSKAQFLEKLTGNYNIQVGAGSNSRGGTNTCGTVNWYNADGTTAN